MSGVFNNNGKLMTKDTFTIKGLGGEKTLKGEVTINGAKNAVLKAMAAATLFKDKVTLKNVPDTEDVKKMIDLLSIAGAHVEKKNNKTIVIDPSLLSKAEIDQDIAKSMRASVVMTGPLLGRFGKVTFPAPGGCVIGARPIDQFIEGYKKMGAKVELKNDAYVISVAGGKLHGAEIIFNLQTVGGTETLMMAAVLAKGKTVLKNCAMEPEIVSLAEFLNSCGAKIKGAGTPTIEITGVSPLSAKKPYVTIPDRIEAGSFLILGALCADELRIQKCNPSHLEIVIAMLKDAGVPITTGKDFIHIKGNGKIPNSSFKSFNVRTHEYPGFPTDLQAPIVTFLTQASGESQVFETIYEARFKYTQDLIKMGATITIMNPREILIKGGAEFKAVEGEEVEAFDIRAGFATVTAALIAKGNSVINNAYYIDRGYEHLEDRLKTLGAKIERIKEESPVI
jgi:UDP-N-acetylglucosamine 1-carboxyvinyltransferase